VDGVERSFTQLDPNEIESVTILKDASATSVYGIKGANGVIIITTKRGRQGAPKISVSTSYGLQVPTRLPEFADSYTWGKMYNEAVLNDDPAATAPFTDEILEKYRTQSDPLTHPSTVWMDYVLRSSAPQTQQNFNISGGTEKVSYFVSLGHLFQDGLVKDFGLDYNNNYTFRRFNYRANVDINVTQTTKLGITTGGRSENRHRPNNPWENAGDWRYFMAAPPMIGSGFVDGKRVVVPQQYIAMGGTFPVPDGLHTTYGNGFVNDTRNVLNFDVDLNQQLDFVTPGLQFRAKVSYNSLYSHGKTRSKGTAYYEAWYRADVDPAAAGDSTIVYRKKGIDGILGYSESFGKDRDWYMEGGFTYDRSFGSHNVTGLLLYNQKKAFYPSVYPGIAMGYVGLVGRATYDFRTKYMLEFNLGYNGSENFAPGNRFGLFPSLSAGWVITEEDFMQRIGFLSYLKIRGSYGVVGNDRQGGNRFLYLPDAYDPDATGYNYDAGGYNFGIDNPQSQPIAKELKVGNPEVTWEKAAKRNIGFDMRLFDGRFGLNMDYFYEYRDNILAMRESVPVIVALTLPAVNIGEVENRGYEIELIWRDKAGDFSYYIKPNMSFARNKVLFKDEVPKEEDYLMETGQRVNQPFVYRTDGFWTEEDLTHLEDFPDHGPGMIPGAWRFKDLNDDGVINQLDQEPYGFPEYPEYVFSTSAGLSFRGFDLSMLWTGATNVSRLLFLNSTWVNPFGPNNTASLLQYMVDERWTPETASSANFPSMSFNLNNTNGSNVRASDWTLKDASYIRLKTLEVGYTFDQAALRRLGMSSLRIYANGYNLLTFDKIKHFDPEIKTSDLVPFYPLMQIYNMGINVTF
jgi:TonB-linked SusC/RagA family outer membrane protein